MALITVEQLSKIFQVPIRTPGVAGTLTSLVARRYREVRAVDAVSFQIQPGEMVGYLGPNGSGKSTTMKMLTGILVPSSGQIDVAGRVPHRQRVEHVRQIGVVFGQRTQLWWDLPTIESFELLRHIYRLPVERWQASMKRLAALLELEPFLNTPVRQLSLGQRMRADLAAALLHEPPLLFLDEPTIGLDVVARERMRACLEQLNREQGVTVILTTHDLGDIERLCQRVILIDHGKVLYDGALAALRNQLGRWRTLVIDLDATIDLSVDVPGTELVRRDGPRIWLRFDRAEHTAAELIGRIAASYPVRDLMVEEPEIEAIVREIYTRGL